MVCDNGFCVRVISRYATDFSRQGYNYVKLMNGAEYQVELSNNRDVDADASISIDGEDAGRFRVPAHGSITLDRPAGVARQFTFYSETSYPALSSGAIPGSEVNGLLQVTFYPEKQRFYASRVATSPMMRSVQSRGVAPTSFAATRGVESGVTVLGDASSQRFGQTSSITDIDRSNITTITLRLVADTNPYGSLRGSRSPRYNPYPTSVSPRFSRSPRSPPLRLPPRIDDLPYRRF